MNNSNKAKHDSLERRQGRIRAKIFGTAEKPRLSVTRSLNNVFLQLIDDHTGRTLVSVHSKALKQKDKKTVVAFNAGETLAKLALAKGITTCVFDRGGRQYHGRVKAIADGARQGGLKF
jgi:large subunit ribosomal protein L18